MELDDKELMQILDAESPLRWAIKRISNDMLQAMNLRDVLMRQAEYSYPFKPTDAYIR